MIQTWKEVRIPIDFGEWLTGANTWETERSWSWMEEVAEIGKWLVSVGCLVGLMIWVMCTIPRRR